MNMVITNEWPPLSITHQDPFMKRHYLKSFLKVTRRHHKRECSLEVLKPFLKPYPQTDHERKENEEEM